MIQPFQSHENLLADIQAACEDTEHAHLWWLGQSGFLLQWQGQHLLFDPYLSDSLTKKYAATDKPHVRMTGLVVDPGALGFVDVVTSSHHHTDHFDGETLGPLLRANPEVTVIVPAANQAVGAERLGIAPHRLTTIDDGQSLTAGGFNIHALPSAHDTIERDNAGRCRFLGYVVEFGGMAVYHSGDTVRYDGLAERLQRWTIDVGLLPINGRLPERRVAGNLWGREAAELARDCRMRLVVPCHFEMFEFNTATPDEFVARCAELGQAYRVLRAGERLRYCAADAAAPAG